MSNLTLNDGCVSIFKGWTPLLLFVSGYLLQLEANAFQGHKLSYLAWGMTNDEEKWVARWKSSIVAWNW